jgi:hypothetical protein
MTGSGKSATIELSGPELDVLLQSLDDQPGDLSEGPLCELYLRLLKARSDLAREVV